MKSYTKLFWQIKDTSASTDITLRIYLDTPLMHYVLLKCGCHKCDIGVDIRQYVNIIDIFVRQWQFLKEVDLKFYSSIDCGSYRFFFMHIGDK